MSELPKSIEFNVSTATKSGKNLRHLFDFKTSKSWPSTSTLKTRQTLDLAVGLSIPSNVEFVSKISSIVLIWTLRHSNDWHSLIHYKSLELVCGSSFAKKKVLCEIALAKVTIQFINKSCFL